MCGISDILSLDGGETGLAPEHILIEG
jgi:hypothetical protein